MAEKQAKIEYLLFFIPVFMAGAVGGFLSFVNHSNPMPGFLWGIGVGLVILIVCGIGFFGWEWIKKEVGKGKLLPYLLIGFLAAIAISGMLAINLGKPSCDEHADSPYSGSCVLYADDGFEATGSQKWNEFWSALPIAIVICVLIAYIVSRQVVKDSPKYFKSHEDDFSVSIFPERIDAKSDDDSTYYRYMPIEGIQYLIDVTLLDKVSDDENQAHKMTVSWHKHIVSAATGTSVRDIDYSDGDKQHIKYVYGKYPVKNDLIYYCLTLVRYGKIYSLSMLVEKRFDDSRIFPEFLNSFKFAKI